MNTHPLISIITVTYNAGKVIGKTLDSLKEQTFHDFEHLVIDGKSTDNTLTLIKDKCLTNTEVVSEPDKGLYDAMNKGIRKAKGKYLLFLNAGDSFHDAGTLEMYAREATKDKDIIYGDTIICDLDGNCLGPRHLSVPERLTTDSFSHGMLICHQAFMVKKELAPFYNDSYRFSADYDWCQKCISAGDPAKYVNLKAVTINYLNDGLTDKNKKSSLIERFRIMRKHYGLPKTVSRHLSFVARALKRGKL